MDKVIEVALTYLDCDAYQPRDVSLQSRLRVMKSKKRNVEESDESSSDSSLESEESSLEDESEDEVERKSEKKKMSVKEDMMKETKGEVSSSPKPDPIVQSNVEDLAERFKHLELKLGERISPREAQGPRARTLYCVMCGTEGHGVRDCVETKFLVGQGICRIDTNNKVVMSDGTLLPRAEGSGGSAKVIKTQFGAKSPSGPTTTSAPVKVVSGDPYCNNEPTELAVLGAMEFEVVPAERTEKAKKSKPYDRKEEKKVTERNAPGPVPVSQVPPNRAYVDVPPTILKRPEPAEHRPAEKEDEVMKEAEVTPKQMKGKEREQPAIVPNPVQVPVGPKPHIMVPKGAPKVEIKSKTAAENSKVPQYKYRMELMNTMNQEEVFKRLLDQPVMIRLGDILGTSYEMGKRFQTAMRSQRYLVQKAMAAYVEALEESNDENEEELDANDEGENERECIVNAEPAESQYFSVFSGEASFSKASMSEFHDSSYQEMMERDYESQFAYLPRDVFLARPHEYRAMVTARLNGKVGDMGYMMLIDSGSELNVMTLTQARELSLPIDDSGHTWTLRGISGHPLGLEGICWNIPVEIGGVEFSHNFFVTHSNLGSNDMILGQPWLFSYSTRIDYIHGMGVTLQLWEDGDRQARSVLVHLPLIKAPRNVMPMQLRRKYEVNNAVVNSFGMFAQPGDNAMVRTIPKFMSRVEEALRLTEQDAEKLRPVGLNEDLILKSSCLSPFIAEILKKTWFASVKEGTEMLQERIERLKRNVGISPIYESAYTDREEMGAKYKPVSKKIIPVSTQDPEGVVPQYEEIQIDELPDLPVVPARLEEAKYTERLTKEQVWSIITRVPKGFLTKSETELFVHILLQNDKVIAFTDLERGTFSQKYYPDYVIRTIPHTPWLRKPIRLPQSRREEVIKIMKEQMASHKYEPSSASYRSTFFAVEKKGGTLRVVHDLQPLNAVMIRDATLLPRVDNMIELFVGQAVYGLFDLKSGYDSRILAPISQDLTSFYVEGMGLLRLTCLPQGHTNSIAEFQRCTQHMIGPMFPEKSKVFIDDCAAKGPKSRYNEETIPENGNIRVFVWEYAKTVQELLARIYASGATISGTKMVLATPRLQLLGAEVALDGAHVSHEITAKLAKWPTCRNPTEVRGFLGTIGVVCRWIQNFANIAKPLTLLTKKMLPNEFVWMEEAQEAMDRLKHLTSVAVLVRTLDYELVRRVKAKDQREDDLGLVSIHVDSSNIGVGWMISQKLRDLEYPIVFGSITFNDREGRYSQPKLELYGVFRALKAEWYRLHNIHFKLIVDAGFIVQMMSSPDLPNAAMTRWITYIQLFSFELQYKPGVSHCVPDGLSCRQRADEDSEFSGDDIDVDDGIKLVKALPVEFEVALKDDYDMENGVRVRAALEKMRMNHIPGEIKAMEVRWFFPESLRYDHYRMYAGEGEELDSEAEREKLDHPHHVRDIDDQRFWDDILRFLHFERLPEELAEANKVHRRVK